MWVLEKIGQRDPALIWTSHVERQNLSMRMGIRRFTRLTNAFSKKWENHWAALCLWFAFYTFVASINRSASTSDGSRNCRSRLDIGGTYQMMVSRSLLVFNASHLPTVFLHHPEAPISFKIARCLV